MLLGTLLIPLGLMPKPERTFREHGTKTTEDTADGIRARQRARCREAKPKFRRPPKEPILKIGMLPIARGDTERLRQILSLQSRIADLEMSPRAKRALMHRSPFEDALTWFEIHGQAPAVLEHWKGFIEALGPEALHRRRLKATAAAAAPGDRAAAAGGAVAAAVEGAATTVLRNR